MTSDLPTRLRAAEAYDAYAFPDDCYLVLEAAEHIEELEKRIEQLKSMKENAEQRLDIFGYQPGSPQYAAYTKLRDQLSGFVDDPLKES